MLLYLIILLSIYDSINELDNSSQFSPNNFQMPAKFPVLG